MCSGDNGVMVCIIAYGRVIRVVISAWRHVAVSVSARCIHKWGRKVRTHDIYKFLIFQSYYTGGD